jgi:mannose-6-phosphate isomerase
MTHAAVAEFRRFAFATLLPLCRDRFADPVHGGFHEQLDPWHAPLPIGSKRLLVQCRQLYVLSHAAWLGERSGQDAAERGYAFLRRAYRDHRHGGWFFRASVEGTPIDRSKDLYGHAFVLFALAWLHRGFGAPEAIPLAAATFDELARIATPGGGFWDKASETWEADRSVRRQNPHMHLLEALLALHAATGEARWLDEASRLVRLCLERFHDAPTATLGEYFAHDWAPEAARGAIVEPGHHYEWVWLLHAYRAAGGTEDVTAAADGLFATALRHGHDAATGGIHDQIDRAGTPLLTSRRIWPVTEAIKAHAARREAGQPVPDGEPGRLIEHLFRDFLLPGDAMAGPGRWIETMTRDGTPQQTNLPGSTPYHLFLAAAEADRVLGEPGVAPPA